MVGRSGLEPPTSRLSGACSSQLSYRPTSESDYKHPERAPGRKTDSGRAGSILKWERPAKKTGLSVLTWRQPALPSHPTQYHRRNRLYFRVRNGIGCFPVAMTTRNFR